MTGQELEELRVQRKITRRQLANTLGVSEFTIYRTERMTKGHVTEAKAERWRKAIGDLAEEARRAFLSLREEAESPKTAPLEGFRAISQENIAPGSPESEFQQAGGILLPPDTPNSQEEAETASGEAVEETPAPPLSAWERDGRPSA